MSNSNNLSSSCVKKQAIMRNDPKSGTYEHDIIISSVNDLLIFQFCCLLVLDDFGTHPLLGLKLIKILYPKLLDK